MDDQAKRDLSWVAIWGATTVLFGLIGWTGRNDWWIAALITGSFFYFYGVASFGAWRDRVAQRERNRNDENDS